MGPFAMTLLGLTAGRSTRLVAAMLALTLGSAAEPTWKAPAVTLAATRPYPRIACTATERDRLRSAWAGTGPTHDVVAAVVQRADAALAKPPDFPPRGGQHNQWYQCERCQVALQTVDATHHKCPLCNTIYSGPPYDDVLFTARHQVLLQGLLDAAWAAAITDDPKYAAHARAILLGYAERYQAYPYHANTTWNLAWRWISGGHLFEQTLGEAWALCTYIAPAYDLVHEQALLTPDDHQRLRVGLLLPMLETIDKYKAGVNNWQSWHNAAMFSAGAVLGEVAWMRKAVFGGPDSPLDQLIGQAANVEAKGLHQAGNGFLFQMQHSVTPDGMWYENSWGYHFYALQALANLVEAARRLDIDLWPTPRFQSLFTLPARYALPDGTLPRFGDDVSSSARGHADLFEPAYAASADPALLPLLAATPTWESVLYGRNAAAGAATPTLNSEVFTGAGHAILRTSGPAALTSAFAFGEYGGYHGHLDKLSFVLFGYGQELGVDPGRARSQAYRLPIHALWYKATLAHNTVLVDGQSQQGVAARLTLFSATPVLAVAAAECDQAYPGVLHRRVLLQTERYLLIVDELTADTSRRFDWLYHNRGEQIDDSVATTGTDLKGRFAGSEFIQDAREGRTADPVRLAFTAAPITVHLTMAGAPATTVTTGTGVGASVTERVPLALVTRAGNRTHFVALIEPVTAGQPAQTRDLSVREDDGAMAVSLSAGNDSDAFRIAWGKQLEATLGGQAPVILPFYTK
jgi:hypothetical protein